MATIGDVKTGIEAAKIITDIVCAVADRIKKKSEEEKEKQEKENRDRTEKRIKALEDEIERLKQAK